MLSTANLESSKMDKHMLKRRPSYCKVKEQSLSFKIVKIGENVRKLNFSVSSIKFVNQLSHSLVQISHFSLHLELSHNKLVDC